jgi:hypothetical protein
MKPHSITYKTQSTGAEASGVAPISATLYSLAFKPNQQFQRIVFTLTRRHSCTSRLNKQTPGTKLNTATRHSLQPKDFLKILAVITANSKYSKYVPEPTRPVPAQYISPTKKGWKTHGTQFWVTYAPTPSPYHLKSTICPFRPSLAQH